MEEDSLSASAEGSGVSSEFIRKLRRSSRNRESHDEIAELEAELRRAYIAKELQAQIEEREVERYIENVRKREATEFMRLEQQVDLEEDLLRRSVDLKRSEDYRKHLEEQMIRKEEEKKIRMEEARKEREILEEVDKMREECERSKILERKNEMADRMRQERLILQEMRVIRRQEEEELEARKLQEDLEYLNEIDQRMNEMKKLRKEQIERHERVVNKIADMIVGVETEKCRRREVISEIVAEDVKCELLIREKEESLRRKKMKEELAVGLVEQMVFSERCKLRFVEQDRAFAEEIMRKIMEDEKTARLTAEARRRVQCQYREDLSRLIEERRRIREEEIARVEEAVKEERSRERMRRDRIREERKRLLDQHALNIADFVNKGALTPEEQAIIVESLKKKHLAETPDKTHD